MLLVLSLSQAQGQTSPPESGQTPPRFAWSSISIHEQDTITRLLTSDHWPLRVFALLRLERFSGDAVEQYIRDRVRDDAWQVRCFALRQAAQMGYAISPEELQGEAVPQAWKIRGPPSTVSGFSANA